MILFLKPLQKISTEAKKYLPVLVDFYLTKDSFEKQQKIFEAKGQKSRTQVDEDNYINGVRKFNAGVKSFNATNERIRRQRSELLKSWDRSVEVFFERHSN